MWADSSKSRALKNPLLFCTVPVYRARVALIARIPVPVQQARADPGQHREGAGQREGGHIAATLAVNQMMKNQEFRADFDVVKAEVRKGLGLN